MADADDDVKFAQKSVHRRADALNDARKSIDERFVAARDFFVGHLTAQLESNETTTDEDLARCVDVARVHTEARFGCKLTSDQIMSFVCEANQRLDKYVDTFGVDVAKSSFFSLHRFAAAGST